MLDGFGSGTSPQTGHIFGHFQKETGTLAVAIAQHGCNENQIQANYSAKQHDVLIMDVSKLLCVKCFSFRIYIETQP